MASGECLFHTLVICGALALVSDARAEDAPAGEETAPSSPEETAAPPTSRAEVRADRREARRAPFELPPVALGVHFGGGGPIGFGAELKLSDRAVIDVGAMPRVAVIDEDTTFVAPAFTVGVLADMNDGRGRSGPFVLAGSGLPVGPYMDSFVATGLSMRGYGRGGGSVVGVMVGPGWFFVREVPNVDTGVPFLLLARLSLRWYGS